MSSMKNINILLENERLIAINKTAGMLSIPDRTQSSVSLKDLLKEKYENIYTVHRLDKDTSGVIVFAKDEETHRLLSQSFEGRDVEKYYLGLVQGTIIPPSGSADAAIMEHPAKNGKMVVNQKGKPSLTDYEVLEQFRLYSWVKFRIHTGRTHQIRVHMQHLGNPIVCDELYGKAEPVFVSSLKHNYNLSKKDEAERPILARLALHSHQLKFELDGEHFNIEADLPKDLRALLQQLRRTSAKQQ